MFNGMPRTLSVGFPGLLLAFSLSVGTIAAADGKVVVVCISPHLFYISHAHDILQNPMPYSGSLLENWRWFSGARVMGINVIEGRSTMSIFYMEI